MGDRRGLAVGFSVFLVGFADKLLGKGVFSLDRQSQTVHAVKADNAFEDFRIDALIVGFPWGVG